MTLSVITRNALASVVGRQPRGLSPAFSRTSAAYQGDGRLVGVGVPRFETIAGRRGVLVEEATTNRAINRLFTNPTDEWGAAAGITRSSRVTDTPFGVRPVLVVDGPSALYINIGIAYRWTLPGADKPVALTIWMRNLGDSSGTPSFYLGVAYKAAENVLAAGGGWIPVRRTFQPGEYAATGQLHWLKGVTGQVEVCALQVEYDKAYATSFADGTRAAELLTLPTSLLDPTQGTVEMWAWLPDGPMSYLFVVGGADGNHNRLYVNGLNTGAAAQQMKITIGDGTGSAQTPFVGVSRNAWHYYAARWTPTLVQLTVDSTTVQIGRSGGTPTFGALTYVGSSLGGFQANAHISGLRIHRRALSDEEIAAHATCSVTAHDGYHYPLDGDLWPAPGSLGAVEVPSVATRPGQSDVITR